MKRTTPLRRSSPLPRGETPIKRVNAKRKGHRFPKHVNEAYREWIRGLQCVLVGRKGHVCRGAVRCCHVKSRGAGGVDVGNCYPGCDGAHNAQHLIGIQSFQVFYRVDLAAVAAELGQRYELLNGAF